MLNFRAWASAVCLFLIPYVGVGIIVHFAVGLSDGAGLGGWQPGVFVAFVSFVTGAHLLHLAHDTRELWRAVQTV
jgi:hypothetical protein